MSLAAPGSRSGDAQWFATTHWSVILAARPADSPQATEALQQLCCAYWPPLYAYIRREGYNSADAQDLTQDFFARILEKDYLNRLQQDRGKFRSFLLAYLKHFLLEQRRKSGRQKRGGGEMIVSVDECGAESGFLLELVDRLSPDQVYERRWAQTVMQTAVNRLRKEYVEGGRRELFEVLQGFHPNEPGGESYAQLGRRLGMTEGAVKSAMQRLRLRHREILREEVAQTVSGAEEIDEELRYLRAILAGSIS